MGTKKAGEELVWRLKAQGYVRRGSFNGDGGYYSIYTKKGRESYLLLELPNGDWAIGLVLDEPWASVQTPEDRECVLRILLGEEEV